MVAQPRVRVSVEHYLQHERTSPSKHEYLDGRVFAMAGASEQHNLLVAHVLGILYGQLRKGSCRAYASDLRVRVPSTNFYTYPDVSVVCGSPSFDPLDADTLLNPIVVMEVLSPSTESYDRGKKFEQYRAIPALSEYILISQDRSLIEQYTRQANDRWLLTLYQMPESQLILESINCSLLLADIYEGIAFHTEP
ncbi:MAG: Uma2 family endonuclease [Kouleothrix sp.]|jgi:Uma2 family endonuclease|nr:Uma2 family endonuclease [Kouleothrix sp.]